MICSLASVSEAVPINLSRRQGSYTFSSIIEVGYNTAHMWAKGPIPGYSPKTEALVFIPKAVCQQKHAMCGIQGYVIYPSRADAKADTNPISSAGSAREAWEKALTKYSEFDPVLNKFVAKNLV